MHNYMVMYQLEGEEDLFLGAVRDTRASGRKDAIERVKAKLPKKEQGRAYDFHALRQPNKRKQEKGE